jgi:hypothetical protein
MTFSMQLTPSTTPLELVIRHLMLGRLSSEEINYVQLVYASFAAVEEGRDVGVLRFVERLGGLWLMRLFGLLSCRRSCFSRVSSELPVSRLTSYLRPYL